MVIVWTVLLALLSPSYESVAATESSTNLLNQTIASGGGGSGYVLPGARCDFEDLCAWKWNTSVPHGFRVVTAAEASAYSSGVYQGPVADANNNTHGHFLFLNVSQSAKELHNIWSPKYRTTGEMCRLEWSVYMASMLDGNIKVVVETLNKTSWVIAERVGNDFRRWDDYSIKVGRISQEFNIILEIAPNYYRSNMKNPALMPPFLLAIDNIKMKNCFQGNYPPGYPGYPVRLPEAPSVKACTPHQFQCDNGTCIDHSYVCDFIANCENGEDEEQNCDKVPLYSHCNFEDGWCGWTNKSKHLNGLALNWTRHCGPTPTRDTGPNFDHTYRNTTGMYAFVDVSSQKTMGAAAVLESPVFHRPPSYLSNPLSPYYNSCHIRFYYHQFGPHSGSFSMNLVSMHPKENVSSNLWWSYGNKGDTWIRTIVVLPNVTRRYFVTFEARRGIALRGDIALDDISMSPECFGIGVPASEVKDYDYNRTEPDVSTEEHRDFVNKTYYLLTSCGIEGRSGPKQENCTAAYNNTATRVAVLEKPPIRAGVQEWVVPETGYYTIIAKGAKGGKGSDRKGASRGAAARTILELNKGQRIYVLVGQEGTSACSKDLSTKTGVCQPVFSTDTNKSTPIRRPNPITKILKMEIEAGGGGGGGGTFIYMMQTGKPVPLMVAGGGGGLGLSQGLDDGRQHGKAENDSMEHISGNIYGPTPAGAGGGWLRNKETSWHNFTGESLMQGARGGYACLGQNGQGWGGYGGGGGGCSAGGGGGGYTGGDAWSDKDFSGEGGYSYIGIGDFRLIQEGEHEGSGAVYFIPAIAGCKCDYRCVAMDEFRRTTRCLCPADWYLDKNGFSCVLPETPHSLLQYLIFATIAAISILMVCFLGVWLYSRYQHKKNGRVRRRMLNGPDLQLNRIREASNSMMTEFNPNYEFGGATYTIRDLKDIPRDHLRLVKALGQGAFGEVYQGFFRHRDGDAVEMPVAVKTLPELSSNQAETDFLMEALIMSKFNHPNIVHFIGVCFDKHPRFIVLELLAGGDLKTFLRESRPKPERPSPLLMKDLLLCSMDIAKGCKYMEENRFIHRDIAARNCLLTTKGPGRVVKIADFGMARDIYRADYYRKGGKAMLPIKWMPPEAFLDGIFTTKTDVWSFGVLLWEVMSLGYMPYTGCANRDVMQLVTSGGRLEPPSNCPGPLYGIMTQCWHPKPEERPGFATILERLDYCIQDPDVMNAPLPVFYRPPSSERDETIMRPPAHENSCLSVPRNADYLVPLPCVLPELPASPSANSVDKLLSNGLYDEDPDLVTDWETSFVIPESKSTQPLLETEAATCSADAGEKPSTALVPNDKTSPNKNHNNNNNNNNPRASLKASLSLDPANLGKQPLPYLKVNVTPSHTNHHAPMHEQDHRQDGGRAYTVQGASSRHLHADAGAEISC